MILNVLLGIVVGGMLGHAVDAGYDGRLAQYINSPESYAIKLFSPEMMARGKGGWQGEHAGKWMYAAAKAYERTGDPAVLARLTSVADYLVSRQEENGYLGCYREDKRYYHRPSPEAMTVDWDTWIMAYLIKGFTEAGVATGDERIELFAKAEAMLLTGGILRPYSTNGASLTVSKVQPFTAAYGLYGQAAYNLVPYFKYMKLLDEPVLADDYYAAKEAWLAGE